MNTTESAPEPQEQALVTQVRALRGALQDCLRLLEYFQHKRSSFVINQAKTVLTKTKIKCTSQD